MDEETEETLKKYNHKTSFEEVNKVNDERNEY